MAYGKPASLELGSRPVQRPIPVMFTPFRATEVGVIGKYFIDVLGIVRPIRRDVQRSIGFKPIGA